MFYRLVFLIYIILGCTLQPLWASEESFVVGEVSVVGVHLTTKEEVLRLLDIKPADVVSREKIHKGLIRLFKKGIFEDIVIERTEDNKIIVRIKERRFIKKIKVQANQQIPVSLIRKGLIIKEDEVFTESILKKAREALVKYLKGQGYRRVSVQFEALNSEPSFVTIVVKVQQAEPEIIKKIKIQNHDPSLVERLNIYPGEIYNPLTIQKALEKLKDYLFSQGYYNHKIGQTVFSEGVLIIPVQTGKKTEIDFKGNNTFSSDTLKQIVMEEISKGLNKDTIRFSTERLINFYISKGFINVQAVPVLKEDEGTTKIIFFINEGKRFFVRRITFSHTSLPDRSLRNVIMLKEGAVFNKNLLQRDIENLLALYRSLGYVHVSIPPPSVELNPQQGEVTINYDINEGKQYRIGSIIFSGNSAFKKETLLRHLNIKPGDIFNEIDLLDARKSLISFYRQKGYLNASVSINTSFKDSTVSVHFRINENRQYRFGKIIVQGNLYTSDRVILREAEFKETEPVNLKALNILKRRLYRTGLFKDIDITLIDYDDNIKDVLVKVREARPGKIEFTVGYGEYEGFRSSLDISYRNLWGMNRIGRFRLEISEIKKKLFLNYTEPYLWGRRIVLRGDFFAEFRKEKNIDTGDIKYKVKEYSFELSVQKELSRRMKGSLKYGFSVVKTYDIMSDIILSPEDRGYLSISSITPAIYYDTRDNPFNPHSGYLTGLSLKIASTYLLGETDFLKLNIYYMQFLEITDWLVLAFNLKGGLAQGFRDTTDLPIVERFFLGGRNSVRGFSQDSIGPKGRNGTPTGGNAFVQGNVEFRIDVGKGIEVVLFLDSGNVWRRISDVDMSLRYSTGLGIRYNTPVGPVRIDYGYKLDRKRDESSGEFHFSIGHAF